MQSLQVTIALSFALVVLVSLVVYRFWKEASVPPEERERLRRAALAARGKVNDASLVEVRGDMLLYAYLVRGVEYTAAQDVSRLAEYVPTDLSALAPLLVWQRLKQRQHCPLRIGHHRPAADAFHGHWPHINRGAEFLCLGRGGIAVPHLKIQH